jgi:hypothetical protein
MRVSRVVALAVVAFSIALAVVVGDRMSAEAMAVVIGVVCGVAASIPMSGVILALSRPRRPEAPPEPRMPASPSVYLVAPGPAAQPASPWPDYARMIPTPVMPAPREYRVIGGDERLG